MKLPTSLSPVALIFLSITHPAISTPVDYSHPGPTCTEVVFPVTIAALNSPLTGLDLANPLGSITEILFVLPVAGTFNISARYCEPEVVVESRKNTLQLLVHGATYDRNS